MNRRLPTLAIMLAVLGLVPFLVFALAAMGAAPGSPGRPLAILMAYGAVVLAFIGGAHWGFALQEAPAPPEASRIEQARLLLSAVPALVAWLALVLILVAPVDLGLAALIAGYIATVVLEDQGRRRGLVPRGYMLLRWALSAVVVALLVTVLVVRLLGARIVF
jgi:hypothetical protein